MINKYLENNKNEIIQKTQELIQIPSVIAKSQNSNYPFGKPINDALEYMLNLGQNLGFRTKNLNGYCRLHRIWKRL